MAGRIPQPFIDEVIGRSDIVEVIGARVGLKKSGREYKACCPFHGEKTPSFWVSPAKQFYHCFGCGAHGTVVGFSRTFADHDHVADLAHAVPGLHPLFVAPHGPAAAQTGDAESPDHTVHSVRQTNGGRSGGMVTDSPPTRASAHRSSGRASTTMRRWSASSASFR